MDRRERGDLTCYRNGKFEAQEIRGTGIRRKISAIGSDHDGTLWLMNEEGTLVRMRDGATRALPNQDGVVQMAQDTTGTLWVASGGKVAFLDEGRLTPLTLESNAGPVVRYAQGICASQNGGIWIVGDGRVRRWYDHARREDRGPNPSNSTPTAMIEPGPAASRWAPWILGFTCCSPTAWCGIFSQWKVFRTIGSAASARTGKAISGTGAGSDGLVALHPGKVETLDPGPTIGRGAWRFQPPPRGTAQCGSGPKAPGFTGILSNT